MNKQLKLIIVGTQPSSGRGGISTALEGYLEGLKVTEQKFSFVNSHVDRTSKLMILKTWFLAFKKVYLLVKTAQKHNEEPVIWLHGGAWLSLLRKFSIALVGRLSGAKVVIHIHSQSNLTYLNSPFRKMLFKVMLSPAHMLFALTPWWAEVLTKHFPSHKISIVPNPINNQLLQVIGDNKKEASINIESRNNKINIIAMSRLVKGKGFEQVIEALVYLNDDYKLLIAGDGPLLPELKALVHQHKLAEKVEFLGWLDSDSKIDLLSQSDVFCLPSINDSFGMVYIEAMACGIPVVALNYGAIPDVVTNEVSGILCNDSSSDSLVKGIYKAIENKEDLVQGAFDSIEKNYTPKAVATIVKKAMMELQ